MSAPEPAWMPILAGSQRKRALEVVTSIAADLQLRYGGLVVDTEPDAWTLAGGRRGVAVLFAYLGEALGDSDARLAATHLVEDAVESAAGAMKTAGLYGGFTGVAWTLAHLDGWLLDFTDSDPMEAVDTALLELLTTSPWQDEYDLISGLVGFGVYALEPFPRTNAAEVLTAVVTRLAELAEQGEAGATWWAPPERLPAYIPRGPSQTKTATQKGAYNLGVAHGLPGVVALLGKASGIGIATTTLRPLLDRAVNWLLAQRLPGDVGAFFPALVGPDIFARPARSAWCYGDPGVASALFLAARHAGSAMWQSSALSIAQQAAIRPLAESGVVDAGFCHGAVGLAHIFNRLYQTNGAPVFREAALRWFGHVLDEPQPEGALGRLYALQPGQPASAHPDLLEGAAGIGLALLAATTPLEPRWDRLFLLS